MSCGPVNAIESVIRHSSPDCGPCDPSYVVKDYCFVACTDIDLAFSLPAAINAGSINDLWITIVDSDELDMNLVRSGDLSDDASLFDLENGKIKVGRCDLCVDGGTYYYEILAKVGSKVQAVQRGRMFINTNYRRRVTQCR